MRRATLVLASLAALGAPTAATGRPPPPGPSPVTVAGRPHVVRDDAGRLTLHLCVDRPLARRFDGEVRATADIGGRRSSLVRAAGQDRGGRACYTAVAAAATPGRDPAGEWRAGALIRVAVALDGASEPLVAVRTRIRDGRLSGRHP